MPCFWWEILPHPIFWLKACGIVSCRLSIWSHCRPLRILGLPQISVSNLAVSKPCFWCIIFFRVCSYSCKKFCFLILFQFRIKRIPSLKFFIQNKIGNRNLFIHCSKYNDSNTSRCAVKYLKVNSFLSPSFQQQTIELYFSPLALLVWSSIFKHIKSINT